VTIFKYAMIRNFRSPVSYLLGLLVPVILIFAMATIWTYAPVVGLSTMIILMLMNSALLAGLILEDRVDGSIIKILVSPVSMASYIFQNLLAAILPVALQFVLLGIVGLFRYNWAVEFTVGVTVALLICAVSTAAFSFCWNMFFKSKSGSRYSFLFAAALIVLLSGLMIPIEALPGFMQHVGAILHPYWFTRAVMALHNYGITVQFWIYNTISLFMGVGFLLIGSRRRRMQ